MQFLSQKISARPFSGNESGVVDYEVSDAWYAYFKGGNILIIFSTFKKTSLDTSLIITSTADIDLNNERILIKGR